MPRRMLVTIGSFLAWTLFVWAGRIRNLVGDATAGDGTAAVGPLLLSLSFVLPATILAVAWIVAARRAAGSVLVSDRGTGAVRTATRVLAAWTVAVWLVRVGDIVLGGDHDVAFVVVHVVLAVVSVGLAAAVVRVLRSDRGRVSHMMHSNAS